MQSTYMFSRFLFFLLVISSCSPPGNRSQSSDFIASKPYLIAKINDFESFRSEIKGYKPLKSPEAPALLKTLDSLLSEFGKVPIQNEGLLALYKSNGTHQFLYVEPFVQSSDSLNISLVDATDTITGNKKTATHPFNSKTIENHTIYSSSEELLASSIAKFEEREYKDSLKVLVDGMGKESVVTLLIPTKRIKSNPTNNRVFETGLEIVDLDLGSSKMQLSGAFANTKSYQANPLKSDFSHVQMNKTALLAPLETDAVFSVKPTHPLRIEIQSADSLAISPAPLEIGELGLIRLRDDIIVVLHPSDTDGFMDSLGPLRSNSSDFQGSVIHETNEENVLANWFPNFVSDIKSKHFTSINNAIFFASERSTLEDFIITLRSNKSFTDSNLYHSFVTDLSADSDLFYCTNNRKKDGQFETALSKYRVPSLLEKLPQERAISWQMNFENGFDQFNLVSGPLEKTKSNANTTEFKRLGLDADLLGSPQFVRNHVSGKMDIVAQDEKNILYLYDHEGKLHWKKQLDGPVRGKIRQVDLYKNGRLQLAFCTNNKFIILDRNGKTVRPFDMKFDGGNLNPLAVFDYEGNKNYRFLVTQGKKVRIFDNSGKAVKGFTYTETEANILDAPQHFRVGKKDYLAFKLDNGKLALRHRAGGERVKVNTTIDFSENPVFYYKNKFSVTDKKGTLYQVATNGKIGKTRFNLNRDHGMYATSKTLALMDNNTLRIKSNSTELDLGVYTKPIIFYINDKIYVSVTDIQNRQVYLFDSQSRMINGFPVRGSSAIDLADIDNDGNLELVVRDQSDTLVIYELGR